MPSVKANHFDGGRNLQKGHGDAGRDLSSLIRAGVDDITAVRGTGVAIAAEMADVRARYVELAAQVAELATNFDALLAKIDADSGDTGGDSDYDSTLGLAVAAPTALSAAATTAPAAQTLTKA